MATQRKAVIASAKYLNPEAKLLDLTMSEGDLLNFTGGQYVIVNTNIPLPGGKIAKRAYSILSSDQDQIRFQIAVKKVGAGPGSNHMHKTEPGEELPFSGPWGQFTVDPASGGSALVLATDTGITAALGLIGSGHGRARLQNSRLLWLTESSNYFIPHGFARSLVPNIQNFEIKLIPSVNHPDRVGAALEIFKQALGEEFPENIFLSGDGALLYLFRDELTQRGLDEKKIKIECFFNNPFKKVTA